jgi:hypothetical protein
MSKHSERRQRAMIRAAAKAQDFQLAAVGVEWIKAAESDGADKPKRFSMIAYTGGPMQVSSYGPPVAIDLSGLTAKAPIPILANHDHTQVVGHADVVEITATNVKLDGLISGAGPAAAEVQASAGRGFPWKASVGARPDKMEFVAEGVQTKVNGKTLTGPLYVARKSTLGEVSFVAVAADGRTSAKVAASAAHTRKDWNMDFTQWVEAMGLSLADLRDDQVAKLQAKYNAEVKAAATKQPIEGGSAPKVEAPKFDLSGVVLTYEKHVASVQAKASGYVGKIPSDKLADIQAKASQKAAELKAQALNDEWAPVRLEVELVKAAAAADVELIKAEMPKGPAIHSSMRDTSPTVIEAAFSRSIGLPKLDTHYKPEVLEAADKHFRNLGLQELLLIAASGNGYGGRQRIGVDNLREILEYAFPVRASGVSVLDVDGILSNTGNKLLLDGFMTVPQSWRAVAAPKTVSDFKTVTAYRLTADLEYEEVGSSGEIHHGTLGEESYTMRAKTYAKMLTLTRENIVNDDLGAFDDLRNRLGMGAALKMNKVFWTAWISAAAGAAFWTAARGNLQTSSALSLTTLGTAVTLFRQMAGPDGNMLSLEPKHLLVPPELEVLARQYFSSLEWRDTTANTKIATSNIYYQRFTPVVVPELSNSGYTGYSATSWWLLADPAILASAVMAFLNGQQSPTIESADADFNTLGIQFRGYHDFGAAMTEYRASTHSTS